MIGQRLLPRLGPGGRDDLVEEGARIALGGGTLLRSGSAFLAGLQPVAARDGLGRADPAVVMLRPPGTSMTISSARTVSPAISSCAMSSGAIVR